jgi:hypothetical protein
MLRWQTYFCEKHEHSKSIGVLAKNLAFAGIYRERGDVLFNRGEMAQSIRSYAIAIRYYPVSPRNLYMLFRALAEALVTRARQLPVH